MHLAARYSAPANLSRRRKPTYCHAAIDHEHLTKDVARFGRAQPNSRGGDFAWLTATPRRNGPTNVFSESGVLGAVGDHHWSLGPSRSQSVNAYVVGGVLHSRYSRQAVDTALRGGVGAHTAWPGESGDRCGVANGASSAPLHQRQFILHSKEDTLQIDPQDLLEIARRIILDPVGATGDARVVERHVQPSDFLADPRK